MIEAQEAARIKHEKKTAKKINKMFKINSSKVTSRGNFNVP